MIILGAGGHASEILDIFISNHNEARTVSFFDNVSEKNEKHGCNIIKSTKELEVYFQLDNQYVIGVGNPKARKLLNELAKNIGGDVQQVIAKTSAVSTLNVEIGNAVNIMHDVRIFPNSIIGYAALINARVMIHHDCSIGEYTEIGPGTIITGGCSIGNNVQMGGGCIVLPNISITDGVIIGAGTTITKNIIEPGVYVGSAHKKIR